MRLRTIRATPRLQSLLLVVLLSCLSSVLVSLLANPAGAQEAQPSYTASGDELTVRRDGAEVAAVALPCAAKGAVVVSADSLYLACADTGLLVVSLADPLQPAPRAIRDVGGEVARVFLVGGKVWIEVEGQGARVLDDAAPAASAEAPAVAKPVEKPAEKPVEAAPKVEVTELAEIPIGRVISTDGGDVFIDIGAEHGVAEGMFVAFFDGESLDLDDELLSERPATSRGVVRAAGKARSRVKIPLNHSVPVGATAQVVSGGGQGFYMSRSIPARAADYFEAGFMLRPFLALGSLAGGVVTDLRVAYHFEAPVAVELIASPVSLVWGDDRDVQTFNLGILPSFDSQYVQIGLGAGLMSMTRAESTANMLPPELAEEAGSDLRGSFLQFVRLGPTDGLHVTARTSVVVFREAFELGEIALTGQLPVGFFDAAWMTGRLVSGLNGTNILEAGLRVLVSGNGEAGSLFLHPTVGAVIVTGEEWEPCRASVGSVCREEFTSGGPMVGLGMTWRF